MKAIVTFEIATADGLSKKNAERAILRYVGNLDQNAEHDLLSLGVSLESVLKVIVED